MDRDTPDVARDQLDLSGVDTRADHEAEDLDRVADGRRTQHRALGPVEEGQHAVAGGLDEPSPVAIDGHRRLAVVLSDEVSPARRPKLLRTAG
jgi:hypothetical protein